MHTGVPWHTDGFQFSLYFSHDSFLVIANSYNEQMALLATHLLRPSWYWHASALARKLVTQYQDFSAAVRSPNAMNNISFNFIIYHYRASTMMNFALIGIFHWHLFSATWYGIMTLVSPHFEALFDDASWYYAPYDRLAYYFSPFSYTFDIINNAITSMYFTCLFYIHWCLCIVNFFYIWKLFPLSFLKAFRWYIVHYFQLPIYF